LAANASLRRAAGCNTVSPIAARICVFISTYLAAYIHLSDRPLMNAENLIQR
jgi:hypothetical protein